MHYISSTKKVSSLNRISILSTNEPKHFIPCTNHQVADINDITNNEYHRRLHQYKEIVLMWTIKISLIWSTLENNKNRTSHFALPVTYFKPRWALATFWTIGARPIGFTAWRDSIYVKWHRTYTTVHIWLQCVPRFHLKIYVIYILNLRGKVLNGQYIGFKLIFPLLCFDQNKFHIKRKKVGLQVDYIVEMRVIGESGFQEIKNRIFRMINILIFLSWILSVIWKIYDPV